MAFIVGKKVGMTRIFSDSGQVTPVTLIETAPKKAGQGKVSLEKKNGDVAGLETFAVGAFVKVTAISKAKGFQGAVKRHGFRGMPASHGHHAVMRHVGSIGQRFPQHTLKGLRMAGRMGGRRTTTRGLEVMNIDAEHKTIAVKGAVPGKRGSWVAVITQ